MASNKYVMFIVDLPDRNVNLRALRHSYIKILEIGHSEFRTAKPGHATKH